ncbi:DUF3667 domain-containing protein [Flavobacterium alkalisoli]|uniref:DUF3667 domain-containing protein n=1 Tax=Flavobacterium alkalisoli TaxID=2602769 RepID=A0A5B9FTU1_9FLAO|nr:DUF3667 domain-containing protein [Flavobacterium alkalisoli]QEE50450.1 DUF3667 domain-containing protein [Flavobacterium alkalisoli]
MSGTLRHDNECENCGYTVDIAFCSQCGQKNVETRQTFPKLVGHFAEDLTHYDTAFWRTLRDLLFRPGRVTKTYLEGKRQKYVPPVKLYIFISFVTFFLPNLYPEFEDSEEIHHADPQLLVEKNVSIEEKINTEQNVFLGNITFSGDEFLIKSPMTYKSLKEMDSIEAIKPEHLKLSPFEYKLGKKILKLYEHNTPVQVGEKFIESINHNIPKAIFVYMPIFAFILWVFHGKKRWYFFDHGIFTLNYFSFLLLSTLILVTVGHFLTEIDSNFFSILVGIFVLLTLVWTVYYFYRAHRKMYHEKFIINFIKCTAMILINFAAVVMLTILFMTFTFYNLH